MSTFFYLILCVQTVFGYRDDDSDGVFIWVKWRRKILVDSWKVTVLNLLCIFVFSIVSYLILV